LQFFAIFKLLKNPDNVSNEKYFIGILPADNPLSSIPLSRA
jgi:hypothetical protein